MKSFFVLMAFLLVFIPRLAMAQEVPGYQQEKSADNSFKNEAGLTGQMRVDQFSGAASYNIGLEVSPGRSGLNPSLSLFYNSNDKSNDSWVGQGWSLPLGNIQRTSRRGTNNLYTSNEFSLFLNGQSKEIIEIDANNHIFAPKEESDFLKIQYITQSSSWQVTDTMGVKYYFGQTASSRQDDPADQTRIYKWQLDKVEDTNANFYTLSYAKISGQIYPAAINYTGNNASAGPMDITFNLEDRGDDFVSYQTQFAVTTTKRLLDIQIEVDNTLTFKYEFNYTTGQNGSTSLLSSLVKKAYDGQGEHALPATSFAYSTKQTGWTDATNQWPTTTPAFNNYDHPDEAPQLADFNGDSWTDISGAFHTGSDWEGQNWNFPDVDLSKVLIADINGDKLMDIAGYFRGNQRHVGAFLNNGVNGFNYNEAWSNALPEFVNEEISRTAFVDINGDGLADLIHAWHKGNSLTSWMRLNTGTGWSGDYGDFPVDLAYCNPNINNLDCYSLGTQIVDVNGDGLVDVVKDRNVYLNLGTGFEQEPNQQWILPELPNHFEDVWRWGGARLTDLNGDGLLDITIVADSYYNGDHGWDLYRLAASYLNNGSGWQQNNNWNSPIVIGTKGSSGVIDEGVRLMDINNDNAIDVVKSHADQDNNISRQVYLGSSAQGNQLTVITNGYGGQTELSYQPSGRYFTEDDKFANPKLPLNLETVKTITTTDGQDNEITTDYFYKDGAYYADPTDFTLNQYVGFGSVTGQTSDQVARTFYHQGSGVDGYINGEYEDSIYKKGRAYREEVIHDDGEDWHLLSAKVNTWKQEDLDANRKYVYQDSSVTYDYDADGWLLSGPQNAPTANFNPNQATVNGQLSDLVDLQAYAPAVGEQLVSQSEDGLSSTYYLGRNESGHELFRSESKSILGEDEEEPGRDDPAQENFIPQEGDRAIEVYSYNCPHFIGLWEQHQGYSDFNQANVYLTNYQAGQECHLSRISLPFNTSGLPDDATIISANLSMNVFDVDGSMMVYVVNGLDGDVSAGEEHIGSTGGQNFNLNSTGLDWINLTGNTNLGLRGDYDFRNVDLQGALYAIGFNLSESATATRPVLSVEYTLNDPPLVPADLLTEGEENPDDVADQTPEFSAIYNDDNEEDLAVHYQLQVIQAGGSFDNPLWESDDVPLDLASSTPAGMRIEPIQYGGNNLPLEGYKYFWRIKFWDNGDEETAEGAWSDGQDYFYMDGSDAPTAPIDLLVEGRTEPVDLINQRPAFSAIYIDPNPIDRAKWYEIEVDDNNNFSSPIWDSGKTLLATSSLVDNGSRMAEVAYGGENPLPYDGTNYYWRVKFWDDEDANGTEGDWSANGQFGMFNQADALDSVAAKAVKYSYDFDNGNVTDEENFGQVYASPNGIYLNTAEAVVGDEKDFAYAYAEPTQEALHILSAPKSKILLDPITQASSTVAITYDGLNFGQVNKANPTKEDLKVTDVVYNKTFNSYGLVTSAEDPLGNDTTITYDADYYYPYQTTNELNQLTKTEYDLNCGQVKKITDSNNTVEERAYDAFCRITSVKKTNPALSSMLTLQTYEYHVTSTPPYVKQVNYPGQSYGQDIYSYFDGLGRKIQIREEAETANQFRVTSYSYDTKGNLYRQSLPYFDNSSAFEAEAWATPYTQYAYDAQNRVTQQSVVTGQNTYTTSYVYDGWNVTVTDPNNKAKKFYKDAYGQLIQVDEYLGENTYSTKYEYNLLGKITKITDSQNNVRNFTYDKLGRLTTQEEMHDPEAEEFGVWTMEYDEASNLTSKTDPKNQTVNYTYDGLNRILTEDYTGHNGTEVIYTYDTGTYGKGHLKTASSTGAYITYTYDKWGRTTQETKTINSKYYSTSWEYGYNSLPTKITYPG
ncbi:MAG: SpvB/TcaC N-terminal domain-containing protein, partial [Patescibacteria group bacterium]